MKPEDHIKATLQTARALVSLLESPEPGLISWIQMVNWRIDEITKARCDPKLSKAAPDLLRCLKQAVAMNGTDRCPHGWLAAIEKAEKQ